MRAEDRDAAFVQYVAARQRQLRRVAYAICGDWHQADDLLQTALTKLYRAWPRIERAGSEDAYVRRILLTTHLDEVKRPWRRREVSADHLAEPETVPDTTTEDRDELITALQALPAMQRKVIVLRQLVDLSVEQTAEELGISAGTVKSHHSRGMARLHELLTPTPTLESS